MAEYDARTDEALSRFASTLPTATALELLAKLDETYAESHLSWQNVLSGSEPAMRDQPLPPPLVTPGASRLTTVMVMMNTLTRASAQRFRASSLRTLTLAFVRACCKCMRVRDAGPHARASLSLVTLLWTTRGCGGSTLATAQPWMPMNASIRSASAWAVLGLRNPSPAPPATQALWTRARCTPPAAPWARPRVVTTPSPLLIHAAAQQCDHTSEMEVPGLIPGTDLRPADVLTSALGNAYTALDVSICSPHALEAGTDCTQSRVEAKLEHYGPRLPFFARTSPTPRSCGVPMDDLTPTR